MALGLGVGCSARTATKAGPPGSWRIVALQWYRPDAFDTSTGGAIPSLTIDFEGEAGFARATWEVDRTGPDGVAKRTLNDLVIPVERLARLNVSVDGTTDEPGVAKVVFRAKTGAASSLSLVESKGPFFAPGAEVAFETLSPESRIITEGQEVSLGRWLIKAGPETAQATIRVLFSKKPLSPRLRPEAKSSG